MKTRSQSAPGYQTGYRVSENPASKHHRKHTPIVSEAQKAAMGIAEAVKEGKLPKSKLRGASKQMAEGMSKEELKRHLHESKGKKLPKHKR